MAVMTQRTFFTFALVGLPVGLAISVVIALYLYYNPIELPWSKQTGASSYAGAQRKSPAETDLREYRRILGSSLANRSAAHPSTRQSAAHWISSTLGPTNLGLSTQIPEESSPIEIARTVWAEVEGSRYKNEVIVVTTGYDTSTEGLDSGTSTAMVMSLANAFVGTPQRRSLVFVFTGEETKDHDSFSALHRLIHDLRLKGKTIRGLLDVRTLAATAPNVDSPLGSSTATLFSTSEADAWPLEIREALASRRPSTVSLEYETRAAAPTPLTALACWESIEPSVPVAVLALKPNAPADTSAAHSLATSLEGVLQTLANQ